MRLAMPRWYGAAQSIGICMMPVTGPTLRGRKSLLRDRHPGESRDPFVRRLGSRHMDPGLRRDDGRARLIWEPYMEFGWYHEFHRQVPGQSDAAAFEQGFQQAEDA